MASSKDENLFSLTAAHLIRDVKKKGRHTVKLDEFEFVVLPNVFPPDFLEEKGNWRDKVFSNIPAPNSSGFEMLEMGCGSGAFCAAYYLKYRKKMKRVVGVDINPDAVENTKLNFNMHEINGNVVLSDLFEKLDSARDKFDLIYFNGPFVWVDEGKTVNEMLSKAVGDPGYKLFKRFFEEAPKFLRSNGKVIIHVIPELARIDKLQAIANTCNQKLVCVYHGSLARNNEEQLLEDEVKSKNDLSLDDLSLDVKTKDESNKSLELYELMTK